MTWEVRDNDIVSHRFHAGKLRDRKFNSRGTSETQHEVHGGDFLGGNGHIVDVIFFLNIDENSSQTCGPSAINRKIRFRFTDLL